MKHLLKTLGFLLLFFTKCVAQNKGIVRILEGTIAKMPITLYYHQWGNRCEGYYCYNSAQIPIGFDGEIVNGQIILSVFLENNEKFILNSIKNGMMGVWESENKKHKVMLHPKPNVNIDFDLYYAAGIKKMDPALNESPEGEFEEATIWADGNTKICNLINQEVKKSLDLQNESDEIGKLLTTQKAQFFNAFRVSGKEAGESELGQSLSRSEIKQVLLLHKSEKSISLAVKTYSFTGGAHGITSSTFIPISIKQKKVIGLNDLLKPSGIAILPKVLENKVREKYKLSAKQPLMDAGLFRNKIEPTENIYITDSGIGFVYNSYDIAPYVMGTIELFIPNSEIKTHLKQY